MPVEVSAELLAAGLLFVALLMVLSGLVLRPVRRVTMSGAAAAGAVAAVAVTALVAALRMPFGPAGLGAVAGGLLMLGLAVLDNPLAACALAAAAGSSCAVFAGDDVLPLATGFAVGAWAVAWSLAAADPGATRRPLAWATLLTTACGGAAFGQLRDEGGRLPMLLPVATLAVGLAVVAALVLADYRRAWARWVAAVVAVGLVAAVVKGLGAGKALLIVYLLGLVCGLIIEGLKPAAEGGDWSRALRDGMLAALLAGATGAAAFELKQGLGILMATLGLASAAVFVSAAGEDEDAATPAAGGFALAALAGWSLFRMCYERVPLPDARVDLYAHTTLVGLLLGLVGPYLAGLATASYQRRTAGRAGRAGERVELTVTTLAALALPVALAAVLWGQRAAAAAVAGAVAGPLLLLATAALGGVLPQPARAWLATLPTAWATLAAAGLTAAVALADLGLGARHRKLEIVLAALVVVVIYGGVRAWLDRRVVAGDET